MRTEITIPVAFDTQPLEEQLARYGESEVEHLVRTMVNEKIDKAIPRKGGYYGNNGTDMGAFVRSVLLDWIDEHTEQIIDEAALLLAARAGRKKAWREVLAETKEEA